MGLRDACASKNIMSMICILGDDNEDVDSPFEGICEPNRELWLEVIHDSLRRQSGGHTMIIMIIMMN